MRILVLLLVLIPACGFTQEPNIEVYICNPELCNAKLVELFSKANKSLHCAFYSLNSEQVANKLNQLHNRINVELVLARAVPYLSAYKEALKPRGIMHNKFCIIDGSVVITGSYNPKERPEYRDVIVIVKDKQIARAYEAKFSQLYYGSHSSPPLKKSSPVIAAYFCPEDDCNRVVMSELERARQSIRFVFYSFTSGEIALKLILLYHSNIDVAGVIEASQVSEYSQYSLLKQQGINIILDSDSCVTHHKFLVIDNRTVITGSYNPTKNAQLYNDENIVVIRNKEIAKVFISEYEQIIQECCSKNI